MEYVLSRPSAATKENQLNMPALQYAHLSQIYSNDPPIWHRNKYGFRRSPAFAYCLYSYAVFIRLANPTILTRPEPREKHYIFRSPSKNAQARFSINISPLYRICKSPPIGKNPRHRSALRTGLFLVVHK